MRWRCKSQMDFYHAAFPDPCLCSPLPKSAGAAGSSATQPTVSGSPPTATAGEPGTASPPGRGGSSTSAKLRPSQTPKKATARWHIPCWNTSLVFFLPKVLINMEVTEENSFRIWESTGTPFCGPTPINYKLINETYLQWDLNTKPHSPKSIMSLY